MKNIITLLFFAFTIFVNGQEVSSEAPQEIKENEVELNWVSSFNDAVKRSKKEKKPVLVLFAGSDWCTPCMKLEKNVFHTEKFKNLSDKNFVLYKADFPRNVDLVSSKNKKWNQILQTKYNQSSFPTVLILDLNGKEIGKKEGVYMFDSYFSFFETTINQFKMNK